MSGIGILGLVVLLVALVSLSGWQPAGTRPAAQTRLFAVARFILVLLALLWALIWWPGS